MKKLFFVDYYGFKTLRENDKKNSILFEYPPKENTNFELEEIDKFNIENFFPDRILKNIEEKSNNLVEEFYKKVGDKLLYKNVYLLEIIKCFMNLYFIYITKHIEIFDYIINKKKPKEVVIICKIRSVNNITFSGDYELLTNIIEEICNKRNIHIKKIFLKGKDNKKYIKRIRNFIFEKIGKLQNFYFYYNNYFFKNNKKNILFIGGKNAYLPLLKYLNGKVNVIRGGIDPANGFFNKDQDYYITFGHKAKRIIPDKIKKKIISDIYSIKYKGYSFYNIFSKSFENIIDYHLNLLIRWINIGNKIIPKIDKIITTNDTMDLEGVLLRISKNEGKPSYVIQHGYANSYEGFFPFVEGKMLADKMFVWGSDTKRWMIKEGLKKENLIVTGSLKFDEHKKKRLTIDIKEKLKIQRDKKIICYIAETKKDLEFPWYMPSNKERTEVYRILFKTMGNLKDYFLIVKLHPSDLYDEVPKKILEESKIKNCVILDKYFPIKPLLMQSDLIISMYSSAILEALFFKKPVLLLGLFNKKVVVPFVKDNVCFNVRDKNKLKESITNSINNKDKILGNIEKKLNDYVLIQDRTYIKIGKMILEENN